MAKHSRFNATFFNETNIRKAPKMYVHECHIRTVKASHPYCEDVNIPD